MRPLVLAAVATLSAFAFGSALAEISDPIPIGSGEILIQYEATPTDAQVQICGRIGGEITRLANGKYVCVRRST
jgi:hypothetical protein